MGRRHPYRSAKLGIYFRFPTNVAQNNTRARRQWRVRAACRGNRNLLLMRDSKTDMGAGDGGVDQLGLAVAHEGVEVVGLLGSLVQHLTPEEPPQPETVPPVKEAWSYNFEK